MKRLLYLTPLTLLLGGCEQTKPPTPEGRKLIESRTASGTVTTKLEVRTQPAHLVAGQVLIWDLKSFKKQDKPDGTREEWKFFNQLPNIDSAEDTTGVMMNAWLISEDGNIFLRRRPSYKYYGSFVTDWNIPAPGKYTFFAEYDPIKKEEITDRTEMFPTELARKVEKVGPAGGNGEVPVQLGAPRFESGRVGPQKLQARDEAGKDAPFVCEVDLPRFASRTRQIVEWKITPNAGPGSTTFNNMYVVALSQREQLLHFRGSEAPAIFPEPGNYRLWFCFESGGVAYNCPVNVHVAAKAPGSSSESAR